MRRVVVVAAGAAAVAFVACGENGLLQGEAYEPDGLIPIGPASERLEAGAGCAEGGACDAGLGDGGSLPLGDAGIEPSNTCATAREIGTFAADTGSGSATAQGDCSEWLSIRVTEDSNGAVGAGMKVKFTLTPSGGDFDLFVYYDSVRDAPACGARGSSSATPGTTEEGVSLSWGEASVANGSDDARTIAIAIIKNDTPCGAGNGTWSLQAEGNR